MGDYIWQVFSCLWKPKHCYRFSGTRTRCVSLKFINIYGHLFGSSLFIRMFASNSLICVYASSMGGRGRIWAGTCIIDVVADMKLLEMTVFAQLSVAITFIV